MNRKIKYAAYLAIVILLIYEIIRFFICTFDMLGIGGGSQKIDIKVAEGSGLSAITEDLEETGVIESKFAFKLYSRIFGGGIYQKGPHSFNPSMSYGEILKELEKMPDTDNYKVTIPEGYELHKIADKLEEEGLINREVFIREIEVGDFDYDFIDKIPERENRLEGYLFPDTYMFSGAESEREIINAMLANFERVVVPVYENSGTDKSLDEIVTLASVIEREAAHDNERSRVASVFVNRINKGMRLESCATVQYILKERKTVLSNEDTKIDSPYNTYMYSGLPIGPIAAPGLKSIEAALYPEDTDYLYFLASADGSESYFSKTFEEHLSKQRNIQY